MREEGHAGLWPHFRADPSKYPWDYGRLERYIDGFTIKGHRPPSKDQLEILYQRLGVGTRPSPASLGMWTYWHAWRDGRRYSCPNAACLAALKAWVPARTDKLVEGVSGESECVGDRRQGVDHPGRTKARMGHALHGPDERDGRGSGEVGSLSPRGTRVIDLPSAYPSRFRVHPVGTSARIVSEPPDGQLWTWFALCRLYVPHELPLGPFKVVRDEGSHRRVANSATSVGKGVQRREETIGRANAPVRGQSLVHDPARRSASWPTEPGEYDAWLWREQAYDCREAGVDVEVMHGWGWESYTTDNASWVDRMLFERETMPGGRSGLLGSLVKLATNAAIGYQGIGNTYRPRVRAGTGNQPGLAGGRLADWDYGEERVGRATCLHWERFTEMLVARDLYRLALPYAQQGKLLRLWFDEMEVAA